MIVVDTDVIAAFWIRSARTQFALDARRRDPDWAAPILWRSEFRSVLRQYMRAGLLSFSDAADIADMAESDMRGKEYDVETTAVLKLVSRTGHSSYDCEFVALAEGLGVQLITGDKRIARLFPTVAVALEDFVR